MAKEEGGGVSEKNGNQFIARREKLMIERTSAVGEKMLCQRSMTLAWKQGPLIF